MCGLWLLEQRAALVARGCGIEVLVNVDFELR
jgi:hypothetical protein